LAPTAVTFTDHEHRLSVYTRRVAAGHQPRHPADDHSAVADLPVDYGAILPGNPRRGEEDRRPLSRLALRRGAM
jgi:hypothetical protein